MVTFGLGLVLPYLPLFARSFGVSFAGAGLIISAFGVSRLALDLAAGTLVDRVGERRAGAASLVLIALTALGTGLAPSYAVAVVVWSIGGAGSAVVMAALYTYLLKIAPEDAAARTLGVFYSAFNVGIFAGGFAGGLIAQRFGLASPLFVYSGAMVIAAILFFSLLRDVPRATPGPGQESKPAGREASYRVIAQLLKTRVFVTTLVLDFAYLWFVAAIFDTFVPLFGKSGLGMSPAGIGAVFAVAIITEFAVLYPAGVLADRIGRKRIAITSFLGLAAMCAALGWAPTPIVLGLLMAVLGVASGFAGVVPAAMLSDVRPSGSSGIAVGAFRFAGDLAFVIGPLVVGGTMDTFGFKTAAALIAVPLVGATILAAWTPETLKAKVTAL